MTYAVGLRRIGDSPRYVLTLDDRVIEVLVEEEPLAFNVTIAGRAYEVETSRRRGARRREEGDKFTNGRWRLVAPLTGVVSEVRVAVGDMVAEGDILVVVEAMKMLNELRARVSGIAGAVHIAARDRVEIGQTLIELREASEP